jgi:hypothetical protein
MAASYAVYHGPEGLSAISARVHALAATARAALKHKGLATTNEPFFDTFTVQGVDSAAVQAKAAANGCNVRVIDKNTVREEFSKEGLPRRWVWFSCFSFPPTSTLSLSISLFFFILLFPLARHRLSIFLSSSHLVFAPLPVCTYRQVGLSFGEALTSDDVCSVLRAFDVEHTPAQLEALAATLPAAGKGSFGEHARTSAFLQHQVTTAPLSSLSSLLGRSTKNISSNLPALKNSGGID